MRKLVLGGLVASVLTGGLNVVNAAYFIRLKNGNEYVTGRYWQEGTQVLFDTYGGVFGVDRAFVRVIEKSDRSLQPIIAYGQQNAVRTEQHSPIPSAAQNRPGDGALRDATKSIPALTEPKKYLKKDEEILKQYNELQKRFGQLNDLPKHEVYALEADIDSFRTKVLSSALADAHREEMDALATLQRAINGYVKVTNP
jgi:hypothetical protein